MRLRKNCARTPEWHARVVRSRFTANARTGVRAKDGDRLVTTKYVRLACLSFLVAALLATTSSVALAGTAGFGDLFVSLAPVTGRVGLYSGATGAPIDINHATWGGPVPTPFDSPRGIANGPGGALLAASFSTNSVYRFDALTGTFQNLIVASGGGGLNGPHGLIVRGNELFVSSFNSNSVKRYDATTGAFLGDFVTPGLGGLATPTGLTFGPDGHLYVASQNNNAVYKYDGATGALIGVGPFVTAGSGGLSRPVGVSFSPGGDLFVSSSGTNQILRYTGLTGAFNSIFVNNGGPIGLLTPLGLQWGPDSNLYVVSNGSFSVKRFTPAGAPIGGPSGDFTPAFTVLSGQYLTFSVVPEPGTLVLLAVGGIAALRLRRRQP